MDSMMTQVFVYRVLMANPDAVVWHVANDLQQTKRIANSAHAAVKKGGFRAMPMKSKRISRMAQE